MAAVAGMQGIGSMMLACGLSEFRVQGEDIRQRVLLV